VSPRAALKFFVIGRSAGRARRRRGESRSWRPFGPRPGAGGDVSARKRGRPVPPPSRPRARRRS